MNMKSDDREITLPEINSSLSEGDRTWREKYKRIYLSIVRHYKQTSSNDLNGVTENHHIVPRCLGGGDDENNLVTVPVKTHIFLHYLLSVIYKENYKLAYSLMMMTTIGKRKEVVEKEFSIRSASKMREAWRESMKSPELRRHRSLIQSGEKNSNFGVKASEEKRKKLSDGNKMAWSRDRERLLTFVGARKVKSPDGIVYSSISDACKDTGLRNSTLNCWLNGRRKPKDPKNLGWTFID